MKTHNRHWSDTGPATTEHDDESSNGKGFVTLGRVLIAYAAGMCILAVYFLRK